MNTAEEIKAEFLKIRKKICKENGLDSKRVEDVYSVVLPLLENIMAEERTSTLFREVVVSLRQSSDYLQEILDLLKAGKATPKQTSLIGLFSYLAVSEGAFSELIQALSFILVENGHDIYNPEKMKFVKEYKELGKVSLFIRLQFIEEHGLKYVADTYDRKLRNRIAHLRFTVEDNGAIIDKTTGEKIELETLMDKTVILSAMIQITAAILGEIAQIAEIDARK